MISVDKELCYLGFEQFDPTTVIQSDVAYAASAEFSAGEYQKIIDSGTNVSVETERMVDRIDPSQRITITAFNGSRSSTLGTILDPIAAVKNRFGHQILIKLPREHVVKDAPHALLSVSAMVSLGYEFHFVKGGSYIVTPELDVIDMIERNGLYWMPFRHARSQKRGVSVPSRESVPASKFASVFRRNLALLAQDPTAANDLSLIHI